MNIPEILLVEPNPEFHQLFTKIMAIVDENKMSCYSDLNNLRIDSAFTGQQACQKIEKSLTLNNPYALVFVEQNLMGSLDGMTTIKRIWEIAPKTEIVYCASDMAYPWVTVMQQIGGSSNLLFLQKPFKSAVLRQMILNQIQKWKLKDDISYYRKHLKQQYFQGQKIDDIGQLAASIALELSRSIESAGGNEVLLKGAFRELNHLLSSNFESISKILEDCQRMSLLENSNQVLQETKESLSQTYNGAQNIAKSVESMHYLTSTSESYQVLVDINQTIEQVISSSKKEWSLIASVQTILQPDLPMIRGWSKELKQIFLKLFISAVQAIAEQVKNQEIKRGHLKFYTRQLDHLWIEIRLSFSASDLSKMVGAGLTLINSIVVDKHGGNLSFESEYSKGTTFVLKLPIHENYRKSGVEKALDKVLYEKQGAIF